MRSSAPSGAATPWTRLLRPLAGMLLAVGVLAMHSLGAAHHGVPAPLVSHQATSAVGAVSAGAAAHAHQLGTGLGSAAGAGAVAAVAADVPDREAEACEGPCSHEGALLAACLAVLAVLIALSVARDRTWTSLPPAMWAPAPFLPPRILTLRRSPTRFLLCISRT